MQKYNVGDIMSEKYNAGDIMRDCVEHDSLYMIISSKQSKYSTGEEYTLYTVMYLEDFGIEKYSDSTMYKDTMWLKYDAQQT